jgi:hypothetical protein
MMKAFINTVEAQRALEQTEGTLNAVRVNVAAHVLFGAVVDAFAGRVVVADAEVAGPLVRHDARRLRRALNLCVLVATFFCLVRNL